MNAEVGQQLSQSGQERRVAAVVDDMERDAHISVTHVALATHACHYLVWSGGVAEAGARSLVSSGASTTHIWSTSS